MIPGVERKRIFQAVIYEEPTVTRVLHWGHRSDRIAAMEFHILIPQELLSSAKDDCSRYQEIIRVFPTIRKRRDREP